MFCEILVREKLEASLLVIFYINKIQSVSDPHSLPNRWTNINEIWQEDFAESRG